MKDRTTKLMFLTARIGTYAVIGLAVLGFGAIFVVPVQASQRWIMLAIVGPIMPLIVWTIWRELVTYLSVGNDGVFIERLNFRRFLPFSDIGDVIEAPNQLTLQLRPGGREVITTNRARHAFRKKHSARSDALVARIRRGVETHRPALAATSPPAQDPLFVRMRALLTDGAARAEVYRDTQIPDGPTLRALVADASAPLKARAAAAVALRTDDDARAHLVTVAITTASPSLAALFNAVASGTDDAALVAALDDVGNDDYEAPVSGST